MSRILVVLIAAVVAMAGLLSAATAAPYPGAEVDEVYASVYSGQVFGLDAPGRYAVSEANGSTTFCVGIWNGSSLRWHASQVCSGGEFPVAVDWSGSVNACYSVYTGALRYTHWPFRCSAGEFAVTL